MIREKGNLSRERPMAGTKGPRVRILSPHNGARYILSENDRSAVRCRAVVRPVADYLRWFVDGVELKKTGPPYEFFWKPERGGHSIAAVAPDGAGASVDIIVE
jgi:membrane carboxypeptidase/penicillin-binding protein PbpC